MYNNEMRTVAKDKITDMLSFLAGSYQVFAPTIKSDSSIGFDQFDDTKQITLDFSNTESPPADLFFTKQENTQKHRIIFGLRPCDAKSLALMDKVVNSENAETSDYINNRENTTIVVLACSDPETTCFCTSVQLGPFSANCADVFVIDIGDKYLLDPITKKGQKIMDCLTDLPPAQTEDVYPLARLQDEAEAKIAKRFEAESLAEKLNDISESITHKFSCFVAAHGLAGCVGCGRCLRNCPTCLDVNQLTDKIRNEK